MRRTALSPVAQGVWFVIWLAVGGFGFSPLVVRNYTFLPPTPRPVVMIVSAIVTALIAIPLHRALARRPDGAGAGMVMICALLVLLLTPAMYQWNPLWCVLLDLAALVALCLAPWIDWDSGPSNDSSAPPVPW